MRDVGSHIELPSRPSRWDRILPVYATACVIAGVGIQAYHHALWFQVNDPYALTERGTAKADRHTMRPTKAPGLFRPRSVNTYAASPTREATHPTEGQPHSYAHHHRGDGRIGGRAHDTDSTIGNSSPVAGRGTCAPGRVPHLRRVVPGDAPGVVLRVPMESTRGRLRVARAVPVSPVDVRTHAVPGTLDLRSARERFGCGLAGAA